MGKSKFMEAQPVKFNDVVQTVYDLPLDEKMELKTLLEQNIADSRRSEVFDNYLKSLDEFNSGDMAFSSDINELKRIL